MVQPYGVADDLRGRAVAAVRGRVAISCYQSHPPADSSPERLTVTMPMPGLAP
jgi:hypothetical protein